MVKGIKNVTGFDVTVENFSSKGCRLIGRPSELSVICAHLGFKNDCSRGSVHISGAKIAYLASKV